MSTASDERNGQPRVDRDPSTVARLAGSEAIQRLEVLVGVSEALSEVVDDPSTSFADLAAACVPRFCDLLALEVLGDGGGALGTLRVAPEAVLMVPSPWPLFGASCAPGGSPVLFRRDTLREGSAGVGETVVDRLGADSAIVAPMAGGGSTVGWLVLAVGDGRRGFRPSALPVAGEIAARIGAVIHRVELLRAARIAARDHARTARWLRRIGSVAAGLAGAVTPQEVLEAACVEACTVHDADGAVIRWTLAGGRELRSSVGDVDPSVAAAALETARSEGPTSAEGWIAWPLQCSRSDESATLVLFLDRKTEPEEEISLRSLASLIPIAFERALGTEIALAQEVRLRALFEATPGALMTLHPDGRVDSANPAARLLFDIEAPDGSPALPPGLRAPILEVVQEARRRVGRFDATVTTDDFELAVAAAPLAADDAADWPLVVAITDLSERRRAERMVLQAQKLETMGQVAGRIAHDFNNLLTLVTGYSDLLGKEELTEAQRHLLAQIDAAAGRAAALTQRMLGLARRPSRVAEVVDLSSLIGSLATVVERLAGEGVELVLEPPTDPLVVTADPAEVEQIVLNLVVNALDAMGGTGRLTLRVERLELAGEDGSPPARPAPGTYARLVVADDGPGMTAEVRARCTEPFFTTKPRHEGSGLGLASVAAAAREMGGFVEIDSVPGLGTRVEVSMPLATGAVPRARRVPARWGSHRSLTGARVLLVEDDAQLREMTGGVLTAAGAEIVAYPDAEAALLLAVGAVGEVAPDVLAPDVLAPDVLVADVRLPGLSGLELAARLRCRWAELPVVLVTGFGELSADRLHSLPGPQARLLRKPFRPDQLRDAVGGLVPVQGSNR